MNFTKEIKKFTKTCYQPIIEKTDDLNYAKPYTTHQDKILFMKVTNVDPLNLNKNFVQTQDKKTNITSLITQLENKFLITNPILRIGF